MEMQKDIIKIDDYLLLVDNEQLSINDYFIDTKRLLVARYNSEDIGTSKKIPIIICNFYGGVYIKDDCKKIIGHLPLNGSNQLDSIPLLPDLEQDQIDNLSKQAFPPDYNIQGDEQYYFERMAWKHGYNNAKQTYKYTKQDIIKAMNFGKNILSQLSTIGMKSQTDKQQQFIQSLEQLRYPVAFRCDMTQYSVGEMSNLPLGTVNQKIKLINSDGNNIIQGTYIYEKNR